MGLKFSHSRNSFIKSDEAKIEIEKKNYNIIFDIGERVILNSTEKSTTIFDKFIYSIHNEDIEILMMDKEHYNTLSLLKNNEKEFYFHAHNRIYQYILTFFILLLTSKLFFFYIHNNNDSEKIYIQCVFDSYIIKYTIVLCIPTGWCTASGDKSNTD